MEEFFRYENQREPPSLSNQGSLRSGNKSDILEWLKAPTGRSAEAKAATVVVLDMAAVVHMVRPTSAHTFRDYVSQHLVPFVESQVTPTVTRVDAVWVTYPEDNLKTLTHQHRGLGPRTRIGDGNTRIPKQDRKKTAWSAWQSIPDLTDTLVALTNHPQELSLQSQYMQTLERFVVLMYSKGCGLVKINEAGLRLFTSGKKSLDTLPPTPAALYQHIRRAILQGTVWSQATLVYMDIPDFQDWGWHKDSSGRWLPFWTTLEDSSKACCILLQCGCVKSCTRNCKLQKGWCVLHRSLQM